MTFDRGDPPQNIVIGSVTLTRHPALDIGYTGTLQIAEDRAVNMLVFVVADFNWNWMASYRHEGGGHTESLQQTGSTPYDDGPVPACREAFAAAREMRRFFSMRGGLPREKFIAYLEREGVDIEEAKRLAVAFRRHFPWAVEGEES